MDSHECPLCLEELDVTERNFHPCKCGYQICLFCWHKINEKLKGKCPACRTDYDPQGFQFVAPDQESLQKERQKDRDKDKTKFSSGATVTTALGLPLRKDDVRVLQRNLCYVTGIPASIAKEELLKKREYFGQFGRIVKVAVSKKTVPGVSGGGLNTVSAYVTYKRTQDAEKAINAFNGLIMGEITKPMKASFGTTKYCSSFLRSQVCTKANCLYLHETARPEDCYSREDLALVNAATQIACANEKRDEPRFPFDPSPTSGPAAALLVTNFDLLGYSEGGRDSEVTNGDEGDDLDKDRDSRPKLRPPPGLTGKTGPARIDPLPAANGYGNSVNPNNTSAKALPPAKEVIQNQLKQLQLQQLHQHLNQPFQGSFFLGPADEEDDQDVADCFAELAQEVAEPVLLGIMQHLDFRKFVRPLGGTSGLGAMFSVVSEDQLPWDTSPAKSRFAFGDPDCRTPQIDHDEWSAGLLEHPWPSFCWTVAAE